MQKDKLEPIIDLLQRAEQAHGQYERQELNGVYDQDWPVWYARWIVEHGLNDLVVQVWDADRLGDALRTLYEQYKQTDRSQTWAEYIAGQLTAMTR